MVTVSSDRWSKLFSSTPDQRRQLLDHCFDIVEDAAADFCLYQNSQEDPVTGFKVNVDGRLFSTYGQEVSEALSLVGTDDDPVVSPPRSEQFHARVAWTRLIQGSDRPCSVSTDQDELRFKTVGGGMPRRAKYSRQREAEEGQ